MKKFLIGAAVVVLVVVLVGVLLSGDYTAERSIVINAKPAKIHKLVGDLKRWDDWTPWKEDDPSVQVTLGEKTDGLGAGQSWTSKDGKGSLTFTASDENKGIEYDFTFEDWKAQGSIRYDRLDDATKVTWTMKGNVDMPVLGGYLALMMPTMVGGSFDKGLAKLKKKAEE